MLADCDRCELRDIACADCVITMLSGGQAGIGPDERRALRVLADAAMVPPLRFCDAPAPGRPQKPPGPSLGEPVETVLALH